MVARSAALADVVGCVRPSHHPGDFAPVAMEGKHQWSEFASCSDMFPMNIRLQLFYDTLGRKFFHMSCSYTLIFPYIFGNIFYCKETRETIPILAGIPRPPKTVPFLGPHFGGGEPLSSSFFGTKIWISYQEVPSNVTSSSARMQLYTSRDSRLDTACLEHIFASKTVKSVDVFSRVAALTVEAPQALGKNLDNFRTHKSGPVERVSGSHASTFSCVQVSRAQCKIRAQTSSRRAIRS